MYHDEPTLVNISISVDWGMTTNSLCFRNSFGSCLHGGQMIVAFQNPVNVDIQLLKSQVIAS